jgi:hypothetical protein
MRLNSFRPRRLMDVSHADQTANSLLAELTDALSSFGAMPGTVRLPSVWDRFFGMSPPLRSPFPPLDQHNHADNADNNGQHSKQHQRVHTPPYAMQS